MARVSSPRRRLSLRRSLFPKWWWVVAWMLFTSPFAARAENLQIGSAPSAGLVNRTGLRIEIESRNVLGGGYTPFTVRLLTTPPLPAAQDRTIRVALTTNSYPSIDTFTRDITLKAGELTAEETIRLTLGKDYQGDQITVMCFEDGRELPSLRTHLPGRNTGRSNNTELLACLLFIDDDAPPRKERKAAIDRLLGSKEPSKLPDFRNFSSYLAGNSQGVTYNSFDNAPKEGAYDARILIDVGMMERVDLMPSSELPTNWLDLSNFDVAFIPWPELRQLSAIRDDRWTALRQWLAAGHTLVVYDVGPKMAALPELEKRLQLAAIKPRHPEEPHPGWRSPEVAKYGTLLQRADANGYTMQVLPNGSVAYSQVPPMAEVAKAPEQKDDEKPKRPQRDANSPQYLLREVGLGIVVAIDQTQPFPGKMEDWSWVFAEVGDNRLRPQARLGLARFGENPDFNAFLIRNVGQAPVWTFLTLITLFMVLIGPINYFVLRRKRRLHLLLVTVPASAGLVTFTLLAYATISDGFHIRSRVRSVTFIDQPAGISTSWSRQVFFAGMTPPDGLVYPDTAVVHSIDRWGSMAERRQRRMEWRDGQRFTLGYVPPRTMAQTMVINAQPATGGLRIKMAEDGSPTCRVRNELNVEFLELAIFDDQGRVYIPWNLGIGEEKVVQGVERAQANFPINDRILAGALTAPLWDDSRSYRRRRWAWFGNQLPASQNSSLLELTIGRSDFKKWEQPRRGYIGVTTVPFDVPVGLDAKERQPDLNFVWGAW